MAEGRLKSEADEPRENTIILLVNKVLMARTVLRTVMLSWYTIGEGNRGMRKRENNGWWC